MTLLDRVAAFTRRDGDCLLWTGALNTAKVPVVYYAGSTRPVRRAILMEMGKTLAEGRGAVCRHGEALCVEPSHIVQVKRGRKTGTKTHVATRKKMALVARERSGLTDAQVAEIRASDETNKVLSERYGKSMSQIRNIKSHHCWQDINSPFFAMQA